MPIYEYECKQCGTQIEKIAVRPKPVTCPSCGSRMKRIIAPCTFVLKGDGWAEDGYAKRRQRSGDE